MKRVLKNPAKIVKGTSSAVMLSILIHAALFLLAGLLVVFTVVKKEEKKFAPPKTVERPKMKLKKPKVNLKKTSKPKSTTRIVTRNNRISMPDIRLPEMSGMGDGLGDGFGGGFDMMPDLDDVNVFGSSQSIGNDFEGTFYDFKQTRRGSLAPFMSMDKYNDVVGRFIASGWKTSEFSKYYCSPKKLYATSFMIGGVRSELGPWHSMSRTLPATTICCITRDRLFIRRGGGSVSGVWGIIFWWYRWTEKWSLISATSSLMPGMAKSLGVPVTTWRTGRLISANGSISNRGSRWTWS